VLNEQPPRRRRRRQWQNSPPNAGRRISLTPITGTISGLCSARTLRGLIGPPLQPFDPRLAMVATNHWEPRRRRPPHTPSLAPPRTPPVFPCLLLAERSLAPVMALDESRPASPFFILLSRSFFCAQRKRARGSLRGYASCSAKLRDMVSRSPEEMNRRANQQPVQWPPRRPLPPSGFISPRPCFLFPVACEGLGMRRNHS